MIGWLIALFLLVVLSAHSWASRRFKHFATDSMARVCAAGPSAPAPAPIDPCKLPEIVRRFVARAGVAGGRPPAAVRLKQAAELRMGPDKPWRPLNCEQVISIARPGFVWLAEQPLGPVTMVRVMDALIADHGMLQARLFGSIPVADFQGPEADRSELMRYLAEIAWAPDAALYNSALRWRDLGNNAVVIEAGSGARIATVRLYFNEHDEIVKMQADERGSTEKGIVVPRPWRGLFADHREMGGRRIPTYGEVGYIYDHGYTAYWRGRVTDYRLIEGP